MGRLTVSASGASWGAPTSISELQSWCATLTSINVDAGMGVSVCPNE